MIQWKQRLKEQLQRVRRDLGVTGQLALVVLALGGAFYKVAVEPLQDRAARLQTELERQAEPAAQRGGAGTVADKLDTFYAYLSHDEATTDWLAKLYAIGQATGVELRSASYRMQATPGAPRLERYEISVPVSGSYAQMREFLKRSLEEIPVLSLDKMALKRESRNDGTVQADLKLTLHMVKK